jgi:hypothetical protein
MTASAIASTRRPPTIQCVSEMEFLPTRRCRVRAAYIPLAREAVSAIRSHACVATTAGRAPPSPSLDVTARPIPLSEQWDHAFIGIGAKAALPGRRRHTVDQSDTMRPRAVAPGRAKKRVHARPALTVLPARNRAAGIASARIVEMNRLAQPQHRYAEVVSQREPIAAYAFEPITCRSSVSC